MENSGSNQTQEQSSVRRSNRARKRPSSYEDELKDGTYKPHPNSASEATTKKIKLVHRRNPTRQATITSLPEFPLPDDVMEAAFAPLQPDELEKCQGWTDLESEPSFFNFILQELGVHGTKIQEVFSIDEESFGFLPRPIHGLIFLYQFVEDQEEQQREECPQEIWFANQTTPDACATFAMLNIVMNSPGLVLGKTLEDFKAETQNVTPALRGYALSKNATIRSIHNTFARRTDILKADLQLSNEQEDAARKVRSKQSAGKKKAQARRSKKKASSTAAFHFIAYVPIGDKVWELDGLQVNPLCLGSFPNGDWTAEARERVSHRMFQFAEHDQCSFNLLALCPSPLANIRSDMALTLRRSLALDQSQLSRNDPQWKVLTSDTNILSPDLLYAVSLTEADVLRIEVPVEFATRISRRGFETSDALDMREQLETETRRLKVEYAAEVAGSADDEARVEGRKKDYSSLLHGWVQRLADKGALKDIVMEVKAGAAT